MSDAAETNALLFVCLGNICRSPLAEGVFLHLAHERGVAERFQVDSAGTGRWHVGERPDRRALAVARAHGVTLPGRARVVDPAADFERFDLLLPMDRENERTLLALGAPRDKVRLLRSFDPKAKAPLDVPDPYFGDGDGFERVYRMIERACAALLEALLAQTKAESGR